MNLANRLKQLIQSSSKLIGSTALNNVSSASPSIAIPAGTNDGDLLILIARCRNDRSLSFQNGWEIKWSGEQGKETSDIKTYVVTKIKNGESAVSFTQTTNSALGAVLISAKASSILVSTRSSANFLYNKSSYLNDLLIAYVCDSLSIRDLKSGSFINGFFLEKTSTYLSSGVHFYCDFTHYNSNKFKDIQVTINAPTSINKLSIVIEII